MFRDDICTVIRPVPIEVQGEIIDYEDKDIILNAPCHLSVKDISAVVQTQSTATVLLNYVLYTNTNLGITIKPNDKIYVKTSQGQEYVLKAGESHKYKITTQTHCEVVEVV